MHPRKQVDLVKSFQTSILKYFLAKIGFDTAENEPLEVRGEIIQYYLFVSLGFILGFSWARLASARSALGGLASILLGAAAGAGAVVAAMGPRLAIINLCAAFIVVGVGADGLYVLHAYYESASAADSNEASVRTRMNIELNFPPNLRGARSRLYRRRFLQVNTRWKRAPLRYPKTDLGKKRKTTISTASPRSDDKQLK